MYTKNIFAAGALLSVVAAVPMVKRDLVWVTQTQEDVVTVPVTKTVWVNPGESVPTSSATHYGHHHHSSSKKTTHVKSTVTVTSASSASSPAAPTTPETSAESIPAQTYSAPSSSSSSVYVAPTTSSTSIYVAPTTSSTSTYEAPSTTAAAVTTSQAPAPSSYSAPSPTSSEAPASGTSPSGSTYTGDITHWDVGLGSCGWTNSDSEAVVAIPEALMNNQGNPNLNPLCGTHITITYQGKSTQAKIVDTCGGCIGNGIDLSPTLFTTVAPNGDGRVHDVTWSFNS